MQRTPITLFPPTHTTEDITQNSFVMGDKHDAPPVQALRAPHQDSNQRERDRSRSGLQLKLRERLKPYLPYLDRPQRTGDNTGEEELSIPDEGWIDLAVIRSWLKACENLHGQRCQLVKHNPDSLTCSPAWLIDVDDLRLVRGRSDMRYFTLSYVWGTSESACTEAKNLELLQQCGSLGQTVHMPRTVAHAVHLTKLLGEHYLWVDRFCIVQDGGPEKQAQLDGMGDIYAGAYATIVAATGADADQGLTGIPGVTSRRFFLRPGLEASEPDAKDCRFDIGASPDQSASDGNAGDLDAASKPPSLQWSNNSTYSTPAAAPEGYYDEYSIFRFGAADPPGSVDFSGDRSPGLTTQTPASMTSCNPSQMSWWSKLIS